ncbi:metal-dependent transcriptional regulator [Candidatus Marinamargulisbacteria bacterium SCGC AG-414-C22]|nr:metal-dependent transcriptional regulator [Candidatus Marinamargulisbacteria bacterium SCGC AG-414-C22]
MYVLSLEDDGIIRSSDVASRLKLTRGAVTSMIKKLVDKGYVQHLPYQDIQLTVKGRDVGHKMLRRHRLIELYLYDKLNVSDDAVHVEAEALEHAVSDFLIDQMDKALGFPQFDPHGDPIPQKDGSFPSHEHVKVLSDCTENEAGKVVRISCDDQSFLQYLQANQIALNQQIKIQKWYDFDRSMDVVVNQQLRHLSSFDSEHIWVVPIKESVK